MSFRSRARSVAPAGSAPVGMVARLVRAEERPARGSMRRRLGGAGITALSCAALLAPAAASADTVTIGTPVSVPGVALGFLACPSAGHCLATGTEASGGDTNGVIVPITNGTPGTPAVIPVPADAQPGYELEPGDIVCPSSSTCYVDGYFLTSGPITDEGGMIDTVTNGTPGAPQIAPDANAFNGIACWSAADCEAVGDTGSDNTYYGVSAPVADGVPGTVTTDQDIVQGFSAVDCPSAGSCDALGFDLAGNSQAIVPITNGVQGTPEDFASGAGGAEFACYDAASCLILGMSDFQPFVNGTLGSAVAATGLGARGSCPSPSVCWTVGETGSGYATVTPIVDGAPGSQTVDPAVERLTGIVCSSTTSCLAVGTSGGAGAIVSVTDTSGGPPSTGGGPSPAAKATIGRTTERNGVVSVPIKCSGAPCRVTLTETAKVRVGKGKKAKSETKTIAKKTVSLAVNKKTTASLTLNSTGRSALAKAKGKRLSAKLTIALAGKTVKTEKITLKATKKSKKKKKKR